MVKKAVLLIICLLSLTTNTYAERDSGASHNLLLKAGINDDWFVISRSNVASRNDFDDTFLGFAGASLGYNLSREWSLRLGYRRVWFRPVEDWLEEDRLMLEAFYARRLDHGRFTSRSRFEYRTLDYRDEYWRFRNEFVFEWTKPLGHDSLRPYIEEEFFYDTANERFEANWLGAGLAWRPAKGVKLKLGYRWNHFRVGDEWRDRDTLVTGINLFF
jgi:hypothetical protein